MRLLRGSLLLLGVVSLLLPAWLSFSASAMAVGTPTRPLPQSSEALALRSPWNLPQSYPLALRPRADVYRPSADWIGRLILPSPAELVDRQAPAGDWVWIELQQAPGEWRALIGRRLRLTWAEDPQLSRLVAAVTTDIRFGAPARRAAARGDVVPSRLDGRRRVGPLQSLAGARPLDDLTVQLEGVQLDGVQLDGVRSAGVRSEDVALEPVALEGVALDSLQPAAVSSEAVQRQVSPPPAAAQPGGVPSAGLLRISRPPVQISGRWQALVRFEGPVAERATDQAAARNAGTPLPSGAATSAATPAADVTSSGGSVTVGSGATSASSSTPSSSAPVTPAAAQDAAQELWRVRHFNRASGAFDGPREIVRIPLLPRDRFGRRMFDPSGIERSPLNGQGWWIQGAPAGDGVFTLQALEPRALLTPGPGQQITGTDASLARLLRGSWSAPMLRRGSLQTTVLLPDGVAPLQWRVGERALLMHLFGGIGGADGEPVQAWTVTGHFAFGEARVVQDPFSGQPRLQIRYHQIYANNPNGIVAGSQDWSAYGGNLQRGWLGTRPFSDALIPLGPQALDAIALQAELLAARYRSGDGQGVALVTAATSCVQDSAQALWIALRQLQQQGARPAASAGRTVLGGAGRGASDAGALRAALSPAGERLPAWEDAAETERLRRLGLALEHLLTPFGKVRSDWLHNSNLALSGGHGDFQASQSPLDVLLSWRSLLPRGAHDSFAAEVLRAGLPVQLLRTNQIPGGDPRLQPLAPTILLGQLPLAGTLVARLGDGLFPPLQAASPGWPLLILGVYGPLALLLGRRDGLLPRTWSWPPLPGLLRRGGLYLLMPAFGEELLFRGLLLPHPLAGLTPLQLLPWMALSTGLFVLYHPLAARLWYPQGRGLFDDPRFLLQCSLLGLACALAYSVSGSLWWAVLLHWMAVFLWLEPLQGRRLLRGSGSSGA